jgi:hypothetical protein
MERIEDAPCGCPRYGQGLTRMFPGHQEGCKATKKKVTKKK